MAHSLITGLSSFMEETDEETSRPIEIGPEAIEEAENSIEIRSDLAATDKDIEATGEQIEMFMERFDEIINRYNHVKKYGVDRTFMRLFNSENELSRQFNCYFPSCESFSITGDPKSKDSVACMEGFVDVVKDIWKFITGIFKKIFGFIGKIFESVRVRIGDLNSQIGRLRKLNGERSYDVKNIDKVDKQIWSLNDTMSSGKGSSSNDNKEEKNDKAVASQSSFETMASATMPRMEGGQNNNSGNNASNNKSSKSYGGGIQGAIAEIGDMFSADKAVKQIHELITTLRQYSGRGMLNNDNNAAVPSGINSSSANISGINSELESSGEKIKEFRKAWKETKKEINKVVSNIEKTEIKYVPGTAINNYLDQAATIAKDMDSWKSRLNFVKTDVSNMNMVANNMDKRQDSEKDGFSLADHKKVANALSTAANLETELSSFCISIMSKLANMCVYAASARLSYRTKASEE